MFLNYFKKLAKMSTSKQEAVQQKFMKQSGIEIVRQAHNVSSLEEWSTSEKPLIPLVIDQTGSIENHPKALQAGSFFIVDHFAYNLAPIFFLNK